MSESGDVLTAQSHHSSTRLPARVRVCACVPTHARTHTQSRRLEVETDTCVSSDSETKKKIGREGVSHRAGRTRKGET